MRALRSINDVTPPVGVPVRVWWWGEGVIVATFDGERWHDERGRIVRGPVWYWGPVE